jgi:hypothetical protein
LISKGPSASYFRSFTLSMVLSGISHQPINSTTATPQTVSKVLPTA